MVSQFLGVLQFEFVLTSCGLLTFSSLFVFRTRWPHPGVVCSGERIKRGEADLGSVATADLPTNDVDDDEE